MRGGHLLLFAVVIVVLSSVCVEGRRSPLLWSNNNNAPPKKCCLPKLWSATMIVLQTINTATPTVLDVQTDYGRKQQAMLNYTGPVPANEPVNKVVIDYGKAMLYFVPTNDTKHCIKMPFSMPLFQCIPEDAEFLVEWYLGPMGAGRLDFDAWKIILDGGKFNSTLAMTKKGCVPLLEGLSLAEYPNQSQLYMYSGFRPGLRDPSVFNLPASCFQ